MEGDTHTQDVVSSHAPISPNPNPGSRFLPGAARLSVSVSASDSVGVGVNVRVMRGLGLVLGSVLGLVLQLGVSVSTPTRRQC